MAIKRIDENKCIGCGKCVESCTADVIAFDHEKHRAVVRYPEDCVLCCWCLAECTCGAVVMTADRNTPLTTCW